MGKDNINKDNINKDSKDKDYDIINKKKRILKNKNKNKNKNNTVSRNGNSRLNTIDLSLDNQSIPNNNSEINEGEARDNTDVTDDSNVKNVKEKEQNIIDNDKEVENEEDDIIKALQSKPFMKTFSQSQQFIKDNNNNINNNNQDQDQEYGQVKISNT